MNMFYHLFTFFLPYRDAAFGNCTYDLTILDCLQGIRKVRVLKGSICYKSLAILFNY